MRRTFSMFTLAALLLVPACLFAVPVAEQNKPAASRIQSLHDLPPGAAPEIVKAMLKDLPKEYQLQENSQAFSMTNPAHGIQVTFTPEGPRIRSGEHSWHISMSGMGYEGFVEPVQEALLKYDSGRLVYERGNVSEWYVNSRWGVEQGFTIQAAPEGRNTKNLVVELLLSGDLQPNLTANTLVLADSQGNSVVKYTGLHVFDSDSKALPSQLVLTGSTLRIFVDDKGARYPVTIDPWIQTAKLTADDGVTNDQFGNSIAISGDTIVVGAQSDNGNIGSAYVFVKPTTGWADMTQTAKLTADDGAADDQFGYSVAISGDTVVVSARGDDSYTGSAYVFVKPVTGWADMTQTAKLTASDGELSDNFGYFVAISGDTIVVGAQGDDGNAGSAYVFVKPDTGWDDMTQTAKLTAGDRVAGDRFGYSVAISNDTIVVGSIYNGLGGSAYVFVKPPGSGWADMPQTAKLSPDDGAATDYFSDSVAISNDTIIVGADGDDDNGTDSGSAYVFVKPVKGWADMTQTAKLTAGDGAEGDEFGLSVAISGNTIVATAFDDDDNGSNSGSAYVFTRPVTGWVDMTQTSKFTADDGAEGDEFGLSVAISGNTIVVGAWKDDGNIGSAYVFNIDRFPWTMFLPAITNKAKH